MKVDTKIYGRLSGKLEAYLFTIETSSGITVKLTNFGGIIISIMVPDKEGHFDDIALGFDDLSSYLKDHPYIGSLVGRYANRISSGRFELEGITYELAKNNGQNHLHGGLKGFDKALWDFSEYASSDRAGVMLSHTSYDMEEGYPGNLKIDINISLSEHNELKFEYSAFTDKTTHLNLTHHGYYNLNGAKDSILDHDLFINARRYVVTDKYLIPTGVIAYVKGTPLDFRSMKKIGRDIKNVKGGYDHCFIIDRKSDGPELAAKVYHEPTGRVMEVYTTEPGIQFYSSNFLDGIIGKKNIRYHKHHALCLEAQHYPDTPNQPGFPATILRPGEVYKQITIYKFLVQ